MLYRTVMIVAMRYSRLAVVLAVAVLVCAFTHVHAHRGAVGHPVIAGATGVAGPTGDLSPTGAPFTHPCYVRPGEECP